MRWIIFVLLMLIAPTLFAGSGKVVKVLPLFLDGQGRDSLMPSLYERDAYQALLRQHKEKRTALRFAVQWNAKDVDWSKTHIVVETRGVQGNAFVARKADHPVHKRGLFGKWKWEHIDICGEDFATMGELSAWCVTLWEGDRKLGEQKSFLW